VREHQGELDLVGDGLSVTPALKGHAEGSRASPESRASETEGAHLAIGGNEKVVMRQSPTSDLDCELQRSTSDAGCSLAPFPLT
jgi:hypothetical protein